MKNKRIKRGVALIWTMVLGSILIIISVTMSSYIIKESKFSVNIEDSVKSYFAASSGINFALNKISKLTITDPSPNGDYSLDIDGDSIEETTYSISDCTDDPISRKYIQCKIVSTAVYNGVTRAIEHKTRQVNRKAIDISPLGSGAIPTMPSPPTENINSFQISYKIWTDSSENDTLNAFLGAGSSNSFSIGSQESYIMAGLENGKLSIRAKAIGETETLKSELSNAAWNAVFPRSDPYTYEIELRYLKDTSATARLIKIVGLQRECLTSVSMDLNGKPFGNLNYLFLSQYTEYVYRSFGPLDMGPDVFDREYLYGSEGGNEHYIDEISITR